MMAAENAKAEASLKALAIAHGALRPGRQDQGPGKGHRRAQPGQHESVRAAGYRRGRCGCHRLHKFQARFDGMQRKALREQLLSGKTSVEESGNGG